MSRVLVLVFASVLFGTTVFAAEQSYLDAAQSVLNSGDAMTQAVDRASNELGNIERSKDYELCESKPSVNSKCKLVSDHFLAMEVNISKVMARLSESLQNVTAQAPYDNSADRLNALGYQIMQRKVIFPKSDELDAGVHLARRCWNDGTGKIKDLEKEFKKDLCVEQQDEALTKYLNKIYVDLSPFFPVD